MQQSVSSKHIIHIANRRHLFNNLFVLDWSLQSSAVGIYYYDQTYFPLSFNPKYLHSKNYTKVKRCQLFNSCLFWLIDVSSVIVHCFYFIDKQIYHYLLLKQIHIIKNSNKHLLLILYRAQFLFLYVIDNLSCLLVTSKVKFVYNVHF